MSVILWAAPETWRLERKLHILRFPQQHLRAHTGQEGVLCAFSCIDHYSLL